MTAPYTPLRTQTSSSHSRASSPSSLTDQPPSNSLRDLELSGRNDMPSLPNRLQRSSTVTSLGGFEFRDHLLPLTLSGEDDGGGGREGKGDEKHVGLLHGQLSPILAASQG